MMYGSATYGSVEYGGITPFTEAVVVAPVKPFPAVLKLVDRKPTAQIQNLKPRMNIINKKPTL